ncbi:hypothetical protein CERSUDRAFT_99952 [Gelatoporia subvermispora B]|uniref:Uncharacterized protein n=1 Tax=Ceriporiopsis subvermispora (strain B) TaxID=914234 RepID=M2QZJ5_CERS8|nr:hypothetical protein CERSUDRAFT_99952 [Gelatoporia subvermispora B]
MPTMLDDGPPVQPPDKLKYLDPPLRTQALPELPTAALPPLQVSMPDVMPSTMEEEHEREVSFRSATSTMGATNEAWLEMAVTTMLLPGFTSAPITHETVQQLQWRMDGNLAHVVQLLEEVHTDSKS